MKVARNNRRLLQWERAQERQDATGPSRILPGHGRALTRWAKHQVDNTVRRWLKEQGGDGRL